MLVSESVDLLKKKIERLWIAKRQIRPRKNIAKKLRQFRILRHFFERLAIGRHALSARKRFVNDVIPRIAFVAIRKKLPRAAKLDILAVEIVHEFIEQRERD